jgi:hypothetical protein
MAAAFLANLALGVCVSVNGGGKEKKKEEEEMSEVVVQMLCGCLEGGAEDKDNVAAFRRLLCAGRLIKAQGVSACVLVSSLGFDEVVKEMGRARGGKVQELATEILAMVEGNNA